MCGIFLQGEKPIKNCENLKEIFLSLGRYQTDYRMKAVGESELMKKVIKDSLSLGSKMRQGENLGGVKNV